MGPSSSPRRFFFFVSYVVALLSVVHGQSPDRFRLSGSARPLHYDLALRIDVDAQTFSGTVVMTLLVLSQTSTVDFHYKDMWVEGYRLTDNNQVFEVVSPSYSEETEIASLRLSPALEPGTYKLSMDFNSTIRTDLKGLYMSTYFDAEGNKRSIATTFMAPTYARMAFPCYDEPEYKANYTIHVTHADKYFALSNMPEESRTPLANNWRTTHFQETKPTSTYIVAFIVCDFERISLSGWPLSVYAQPLVLNDTRYALDHFDRVRAQMEAYVGRSFQYPKLDLIAIDDFLMGAMENPGLITYLSSRVVINERTDIKTRIAGSKTMSHEMAHQFFGNEVTHHYWNLVWLKEGLATLFEDLLTDQVRPEWRMFDQFVINTVQVVMQQDCAHNVRHMMKEYTTPAEIRAVYDFVTYKKAGSVMRMMQHVLTAPVFRLAMDYFIEENSYATATNVKLAAAWQRAVDATPGLKLPDIATVFEHWTNVPGFPVVTLSRNGARNYTLHQRMFTASHSLQDTDQHLFHIPLNYASEGEPDFSETEPTLWLTDRQAEVQLPDDQWIVFNKQVTGYYRVNYPADNWRRITDVLKSNHSSIAAANRAQLIDDALNLARYGQLDYDVALDLVDYVRHEEDFAPLTSAFANLRELERVSRGSELDLSGFFTVLVAVSYERFGLSRVLDSESDVDRLARIEVANFACRFSHFPCTWAAFLNISEEIHSDFRPAVFCGAVRYRVGDASDGTLATLKLFARLSSLAKDEGHRRRNDKEINEIFTAFGCLLEEVRLKEVLDWSINGLDGVHFEKGDPNKLFSVVAGANTTGTELALDFLYRNYESVEDKYESMAKVFEALAPNVVTVELKDKYEQIVREHVDKDAAGDALKTALENAGTLIGENLKWKELRVAAIREYLQGAAGHLAVNALMLLSMCLIALFKSIFWDY